MIWENNCNSSRRGARCTKKRSPLQGTPGYMCILQQIMQQPLWQNAGGEAWNSGSLSMGLHRLMQKDRPDQRKGVSFCRPPQQLSGFGSGYWNGLCAELSDIVEKAPVLCDPFAEQIP